MHRRDLVRFRNETKGHHSLYINSSSALIQRQQNEAAGTASEMTTSKDYELYGIKITSNVYLDLTYSSEAVN